MPTLRARLTAGLLHPAERGDRALSRPIGLVRDQGGKGPKTPDLGVPQRLERIFTTGLRGRTASHVSQCLNEHHLTAPGRDRVGALACTTPTISAPISVRQKPAYAGAFVSGTSRPVRQAKRRRSTSLRTQGSSGAPPRTRPPSPGSPT